MSFLYSIHRFKDHCKSKGVLGTIRYAIQSFLGIKQQKEELETLRYFFKKYHTLVDLKETDDKELRILQKCDTMLLGIIDKLCRKHGLTYWLDYGTLLGAVRHKGFIPWDDDTDLSMPRDDLNRAVDILKDEMEKFGITIEYYDNQKLSEICVHYQHQNTGIWCDITPIDEITSSLNHEDTKKILKPALLKYASWYQLNHSKKTDEFIWSKKKKDVLDSVNKGDNHYLFHGYEFLQTNVRLFEKQVVFPIQRIKFESIELNAPANVDSYLKEIYGEGYMDFPKNGVEHHGEGRLPLKKWHLKSGIDMNALYTHLSDCYDSIK